jgi:hypothetical protein
VVGVEKCWSHVTHAGGSNWGAGGRKWVLVDRDTLQGFERRAWRGRKHVWGSKMRVGCRQGAWMSKTGCGVRKCVWGVDKGRGCRKRGVGFNNGCWGIEMLKWCWWVRNGVPVGFNVVLRLERGSWWVCMECWGPKMCPGVLKRGAGGSKKGPGGSKRDAGSKMDVDG